MGWDLTTLGVITSAFPLAHACSKFASGVAADNTSPRNLVALGLLITGVLNIAFGQPTIAVDTHLFRLGNRIGLAPGKTPLEVELALERIVPDEFLRHAHHWLILHGRYICKARKPECEKCLISDLCKSPENRTRVSARASAVSILCSDPARVASASI